MRVVLLKKVKLSQVHKKMDLNSSQKMEMEKEKILLQKAEMEKATMTLLQQMIHIIKF